MLAFVDCRLCYSLREKYVRLEGLHASLLRDLRAASGTIKIGEYTRLKNITNEAWRKAEQTRVELEQHLQSHVSERVS